MTVLENRYGAFLSKSGWGSFPGRSIGAFASPIAGSIPGWLTRIPCADGPKDKNTETNNIVSHSWFLSSTHQKISNYIAVVI